MTIAIIGSNGQLGMDLMRAFADSNPVGLTHADIEIADADSVSKCLSAIKPDVVINTAAYHKVDDCENNPERAYQVNAIGALNLARITDAIGASIVHLSTDYVFDGAKKSPYLETDLPGPLNVYANTKLAGELYIRAYAPRHYVVRSSGLYGHNTCRAKGRNFIDTMLKLSKEKDEIKVVQDEVLTPTYTYHLAAQIREMIEGEDYGLYHITNNDACSWYEFSCEIFRLAGVSMKVVPTTAAAFHTPIKRPSYSVLENGRLQSRGIDHMPVWRESLAHYFRTKPASV